MRCIIDKPALADDRCCAKDLPLGICREAAVDIFALAEASERGALAAGVLCTAGADFAETGVGAGVGATGTLGAGIEGDVI
jgi:hypothetical protein